MVKNRTVIEIAQKYKRKPAQICLRYCVQQGILPLTKTISTNRMHENRDIYSFQLSDEDMQLLTKITILRNPNE